MKKFKLLVWSILLLLIFGLPQAAVQAQSEVEDDSWMPLCLPGMPNDGTCLFYGPAQTVAEMEAEGFPYPMTELPAASPSSDLGILPVYVAKINLAADEPAYTYASAEDAAAGRNPIGQIETGSLRYISYINRVDINGNPYLQTTTGTWLRAAPAAYTNFQGLLFYDNPSNDFGWVVDRTPSYTEPSINAPVSGNEYVQMDLIQVFNSTEAQGLTWYEIAPDEWVNSLKARVVHFDPTRPEGVQGDRWIEINLFQQTMSVYEDGDLVFATLVASGLDPFFTRPGVFQIYEKKPLETMSGAFEANRSDYYYLEDVPWTMYYDESRALHATYWHTNLGYTQSHGCVNLAPGDANWLFQWAEVGDYVWVHDPSGNTPEDPNYYGPGAP
ncbi:L,D-transpeptidase [Chloroflexota bacterium]|nr:L,D-transpeptidase [Chloroflexota bacterium]